MDFSDNIFLLLAGFSFGFFLSTVSLSLFGEKESSFSIAPHNVRSSDEWWKL